MTLGEHIQALRKDGGLSQEELGEKLGVARQSVSKWEADATIPELDKHIAMSKLFGVSLGALLGLEESDGADHELTDRELAALEAIAQRLTPTQEPEAEEKAYTAKWNWRVLLAGAAVLFIVIGVLLMKQIDSMASQISSLESRVFYMDSTVSQEMGSLSNQVKRILEEQNSVTAQKGYHVESMDFLENTVTLSLNATPREYKEGMTATFSATAPGIEVVEPGILGAGQSYTATLTCPLTDHSILLSVAFLSDGVTVNQTLGRERYSLSDTLPEIGGDLYYSYSVADGKIIFSELSFFIHMMKLGTYQPWMPGQGDGYIVPRAGTFFLWKNDELVWQISCQNIPSFNKDGQGTLIPTDGLELGPGDRLELTAHYADSVGREWEKSLARAEVLGDGDQLDLVTE